MVYALNSATAPSGAQRPGLSSRNLVGRGRGCLAGPRAAAEGSAGDTEEKGRGSQKADSTAEIEHDLTISNYNWEYKHRYT